ncbi:MAG: tRNA pseudouridine(38-40) synthase TruA [Defluviitaleaceae bacterium]|nr:tRNA pseudouridine(38-40) synthase TruA [Defluviitaleaceae bacterium]
MKTLLTLSYDGTNYAGWQVQENAVTVQQILNEALARLFSRGAVRTIGGSRTDAGVHASDQKCLILSPERHNIPLQNLPHAINAFLPQDIRVMSAELVVDDFHPLRMPCIKTYAYRVYNALIVPPKHRLYTAHERRRLNVGAMQTAASFFVGKFDFVGFSSAGSSAMTTVREVYSCNISKEGEIITLEISGNGFLYNMVRIIAGTLVHVGLGKIMPEGIPAIIRSRRRELAGPTMPASGLELFKVVYAGC